MEWQDKIAIADYGTMAVLFLLGLIAAVRAARSKGLERDSYRLCYGIALVCLWGVVHQSYWFVRWVLLAGDDPRTQWFLDNSWILMMPYSVAFAGSVTIAYALFRRRCFMQTRLNNFQWPWFQGWIAWAICIFLLWTSIYVVIP